MGERVDAVAAVFQALLARRYLQTAAAECECECVCVCGLRVLSAASWLRGQ